MSLHFLNIFKVHTKATKLISDVWDEKAKVKEK